MPIVVARRDGKSIGLSGECWVTIGLRPPTVEQWPFIVLRTTVCPDLFLMFLSYRVRVHYSWVLTVSKSNPLPSSSV